MGLSGFIKCLADWPLLLIHSIIVSVRPEAVATGHKREGMSSEGLAGFVAWPDCLREAFTIMIQMFMRVAIK